MNPTQMRIHVLAVTLTTLLLGLLVPPSRAADTSTNPPAECPHTWKFDGATPTWTPDGFGKVVDGNLKIHYTDASQSGCFKSPALFADAPLYPLRLAIRMKSTASGEGRVFWKGTRFDLFGKNQSMAFQLTHDGQWHEYTVDLIEAENQFVNQLQIQLGSGPGDIEVACVSLSYVIAPPTADDRTAAAWLEIARAETKQQKQWEATHPLDSVLLLGAGQYVVELYGQEPGPTFVAGPLEFITWWQNVGSIGLEQWAKDDFPMILDRDHLIYNAMALYSAQDTPRAKKTMFVNGVEFANPARFWRYYDRVKTSGGQAYRRACAGRKLNRQDYDLLRLYAPIGYAMWGDCYLPYDMKMTVGDGGRYPVPGTVATDFTLPTLETVLHSSTYTDAYKFDYVRIFRSEIAAYLLQVAAGYEAIPAVERVPGGPVIRAKADKSPYPDTVTLSTSFGKKPVLLILADGIDGDCLGFMLPPMEPLYQATKDQIDWYLVQDNIVDMQFWSEYYFQPSQTGNVTFRKAITYEERAQFAKMASMRYVNMSFPILLDDLALHTENAYLDSGGSCSAYLVDKKGIITFFNNEQPVWKFVNSDGRDGYGRQRQPMVTAANVKALLDNHGIWTGKEAVFSDWKPSPLLAGVKISSIDARTGTLTVPGSDGKGFVLTVDQRTRLVSTTTPELALPFSNLVVGTTISFTYDLDAAGTGHLAKLLVPGDEGVFKRYLLQSECATLVGVPGLWCPAIAKSVTDSALTVTLAPRPRSEIRGLKFWEEAGDRAKPQQAGYGWMIPIVKDWADHPDQTLTFHLDRATEVLLNGNKATAADIRPGDHLGVEIRPEQKPDDRRPFYIHIYRYGTPAAACASI